MFAKKFLSLVALLFVGSQVTSVSAACTESYSGGLKINEDCNVGYYLINKSGNGALSTGVETDCGDDTCTLVYCSEADNTTVCVPKSITDFVTYTKDPTKLLTCTAGQCEIFEPDQTGCTNALGSIETDGSFCPTTTSAGVDYTASGESYHYVTISSGGTSVFTGAGAVGEDTTVLVKVGNGNAVLVTAFDDTTAHYLAYEGISAIAVDGTSKAKDTEFEATSPLCVNGETSALEERYSNYCSSSVPCSAYCTCTSGDCTILSDGDFTVERRTECDPKGESDAQAACTPGYYIVYNGSLITEDTTTGSMNDPSKISLIKCESSVCTPITSGNFPIGYIANVDTTSKGNVPFVKCTSANQCNVLVDQDNVATIGNASKAGVLINSDSICLVAGTKSASLGADGYYLLDATAVTIFNSNAAADHFVVVKIEYGSVTLDTPDADYRYKYTDSTLQIFERRASEVCGIANTIIEYIYDDEDATIKEYDDTKYYTANGETKTW